GVPAASRESRVRVPPAAPAARPRGARRPPPAAPGDAAPSPARTLPPSAERVGAERLAMAVLRAGLG
ncbi:hypothetical protein N1F89_19750, partial [Aquibium sp. A9E412]|nr:hypothetical protein [Aquibium sp. A9E412]